ncbi:DUF4168 domain-containing protein [Pontibacter actiniarum]|uniref:DUF4168 domain-containing protein n=1 Tax=Pontibacter actiniarum TaxID=323450 RepID=A0A1X9YN18_9BACT|nr:DUF4168 domain-containing protein [Pontibacter actiniarum]ARS34283.1 hypothetical protein CA264_01850 [Pontibacter actiniarum]
MVLFKKGTIAAAFVATSLCFGQAAFAQQTAAPQEQQTSQTYSDEELRSFLDANTKATEIQKESRTALVSAIEEQDLSVDRFNELAKAHRQKKLEEVAENPEEIAAFSTAAQAIVQLQPEVKEKVEQAIEEEGLTMEEYNNILKAYKEDPAVQAQIRKVMAAE